MGGWRGDRGSACPGKSRRRGSVCPAGQSFRRELQVHCYRFLGSVQDAEDALQDTLLSAWQGLAGFEGRASIRTWLYRVATSRCLDALRSARRRPAVSPPTGRARSHPSPPGWAKCSGSSPTPMPCSKGSPTARQARYEALESVSLAFITALQLLPPRQRAALILRDVLGFHASEAARILDTSEESVTSALKRARAALQRAQSGSGAGTGTAAALCRRAGPGDPAHHRVRGGRRARHRGPAHRRCLADHATAAAGVPGP